MAEDKLYEVEQILRKKFVGKKCWYLVRWRGFSPEHDSWEPFSNLKACKVLVKIFENNIRLKKSISDNVLKGGVGKPEVALFKNVGTILRLPKTKLVKKENKKKAVAGEKSHKKKMLKINKINEVNNLPSSEKDTQPQGDKTINSNITISLNELETIRKTVKKRLGDVKLLDGSTTCSNSSNSTNETVGKKTVKRKICDDGHTKSKKLVAAKVKKSKLATSENVGQVEPLVDLPNKQLSSSNDESDDDILYSLNTDCDIGKSEKKKVANKLTFRKHNVTEKQSSLKSKSSVIQKKNTKSGSKKEEKLKKLGAKKKTLNLIDSKKKSKDWLSKSGLLRSVSPPPFFTSVKHMIVKRDTQVLSGHSLPDPVSPEASETYLADVPSSYPVAAEEPVLNDQTISAGSLSYKSLLECLPEQLHPGHSNEKQSKSMAGSSDCSSSNGGGSLFSTTLSSSFGGESVERRTSVRSTECAFRYKQIVVKKCLRYTQIWLNTQTVMQNSLNPQVIQEVVSALNSAKYDDSHLVLFSSLGNVFCSGTDLHFLVSGDRKMAARQMTDAIRELTKTFITFPKPIIAAVSGAVVGLGVSLLALCDVVYASDKASFHLPYSQLSQTPEGCSSFTLPLTVGLPSANELLYGGRKLTAMEAYQQGLVSQVFWPTLMMQEVIPRAQNMASCSAKALEATKLLIRSHHRTKMELTNETECNLLLERWTSTECQRTIEAYISNEKNFTF